MTPGTLPARRSDRAAPLPAFGRAVALISLTVAMTSQSSFSAQLLGFARGMPPGVLEPEVGRFYSGASRQRQENQSICRFWGRPDALTMAQIGGGAARCHFPKLRFGGVYKKPCFQCLDPRLQRLVFLARQPRHLLHRFEFLA